MESGNMQVVCQQKTAFDEVVCVRESTCEGEMDIMVVYNVTNKYSQSVSPLGTGA